MDIVDSGPNLGVYVDLDGHLRVRSLPDLHKALDEAGANWWEVPELQCDRVSPKKVTTAEADVVLSSGVLLRLINSSVFRESNIAHQQAFRETSLAQQRAISFHLFSSSRVSDFQFCIALTHSS